MKIKSMFLLAMISLVILSGCQMQVKQAEHPTFSSQNTSQSKPNTNESVATINNSITWTLPQAIQSFKAACPVTMITKLKLDTSHNHYVYKLEGQDATKEYKAKIDAETGQLTQKEATLDADDRHDSKKQADALDVSNILSIEKASQIAEKEAGKGQAQEWELEKDDDITCWKVKVINETTKTKVKMNAQTGQILKIEQK